MVSKHVPRRKRCYSIRVFVPSSCTDSRQLLYIFYKTRVEHYNVQCYTALTSWLITAKGQVLDVTVTLRSQFLRFKLKVRSNMLFLLAQIFLQLDDIIIKIKHLTSVLKTLK